jgi:hypothetical protein
MNVDPADRRTAMPTSQPDAVWPAMVAIKRVRGALPCVRARERRHNMCWSKYEREQWERERREADLEAERIRLVSATHRAAEPEPKVEPDEREEELVRG